MKRTLRITIAVVALGLVTISPIHRPKSDGGGPIPTCPPNQTCQ